MMRNVKFEEHKQRKDTIKYKNIMCQAEKMNCAVINDKLGINEDLEV